METNGNKFVTQKWLVSILVTIVLGFVAYWATHVGTSIAMADTIIGELRERTTAMEEAQKAYTQNQSEIKESIKEIQADLKLLNRTFGITK